MESYPLAIYSPCIGAASETFIQRHINYLLPGKTIVFYEDKLDFWDCPCEAHQVSQYNPDDLQKVLELLRRYRVRIIMGEYLDSSVAWFKAAQLLNIKFYAHGHGYDVSAKMRIPYWQELYKNYAQAAGIITINKISIERLVALGLPREKIHLVPCGISSPADVVAKVPHDGIRVLAVGRMIEKKAPVLLLDAFRRGLSEYPQMHLDYVGTGQLYEAAIHAAKAFEIEDKVTFHGACENARVIELMQQADIFLQHSVTAINGDEEGFPVAVLEALAHRLPVIATRHAGIVEQVIEGHNGYLVDEFDSKGMGRYLAALARDPELRQRFGNAGAQRFAGNFTWEIERRKLVEAMDLARFT